MSANHAVVDRYTIAHLGVGLVYGALGLSFLPALGLAVGWEIAERPLKERVPAIFPQASQDSWPNMIGDIAAVMLGWAALRYLNFLRASNR